MAENDFDFIRMIGEIARVLNGREGGGSDFEAALKTLGDTMRLQGAVVLKLARLQSEAYILESLAAWKRDGTRDKSLEWLSENVCPDDFPVEWLSSLEAGEIVTASGAGIFSDKGIAELALVPLALDRNLFGFLMLWNLERETDRDYLRACLTAVRHIFELRIAAMNVKKRLDDIIEFMPNPTFIMTSDGIITDWNKASVTMTGWGAEQIVGKENYEYALPFYNTRRPMVSNLILNPDPKWESTYPEFRREGDTVHSLAYCPSLPEGGAFLRLHTTRLYDCNNRVWGAIQTVRDVTGERQMAQNLHRSESMYRAITDFAGVGIMLLNKDRVLYCNERFLKLMGASGAEETLSHLENWIYPEDRQKVFQNFNALLRGFQEVALFEFRAAYEEGLRHYRGTAHLVEYEERPTIHFIVDDITKQKELAEKARINEMRMYHEDRLTALGIMAAGIAHELNQPLNTIRVVTDGFLYGVEEGWKIDEDEFVESLEMVSRQVVRMSQVIQNIRNFAREDRGKPDEDVNPNDAVKTVFSMIGRQLEAHGIEVQKSLTPDLPCVKTNLNRLEQVIMNLIVNARQALDECDRKEKKIWINTGLRKGKVYVEVADNATGVSNELSVKIFDPFFTTKEVGKGTGLGLSISKSIVSEFQGSISVLNNDMGGATFTVFAPVSGGKSEHTAG